MAFVILVLVLALSLVLIALGMPGLWIMIASAVVYTLIVPGAPISWFTIACIIILGVIAEVIEFSLAGKYARKYGGSKRAGWWAIFGGMIGAFMGFPVPIVGPMIGAFVGSFVGALAEENPPRLQLARCWAGSCQQRLRSRLGARSPRGFSSLQWADKCPFR